MCGPRRGRLAISVALHVLFVTVEVDSLLPAPWSRLVARRRQFEGSRSCGRPGGWSQHCLLHRPPPTDSLGRTLLLAKRPSSSDQELVDAVEVAFAEVTAEAKSGASDASSAANSGDDSTSDQAEIKTKVAKALGVDETGGQPTSRTLQRVQELSEQAGVAYVKARDYLEFVRIYIEDRVERDSALLKATIEYVRQRSVLDTRRVLTAAADATRPVLLLADAVQNPSKRSNLTLTEGLVLLQSGVSPLQRARRLESFRFSDDEEQRINAAYRKKLSERAEPITPINILKASVTAPQKTAQAATAASDLAYRAKLRVVDRAPGEQTRDAAKKIKAYLPDNINQGVANFLNSAGTYALPPSADEEQRDIYALPEKKRNPKWSTREAPALPSITTGANRPKRWGDKETERVEEERAARTKAARLEVQKLIEDRELSGITAMAAAAVAATEEANEAETLDRLEAALESARPISRAFRLNSTREEATLKSLRQVLKGTRQEDVKDELRTAIAEREAYGECSKLLVDLERCLDREGQACSRRARTSRMLATESTQLAARATETAAKGAEAELRAVSIAARNVIPRVDSKTQQNNEARQRTAETIGEFREKLALAVRLLQPMLTSDLTESLLNMLIEVAKIEAVVETATSIAEESTAVQEYTDQLEKLNTLDADSSIDDLAFPVGKSETEERGHFEDIDDEVLSMVGKIEDLKSAGVVDVLDISYIDERDARTGTEIVYANGMQSAAMGTNEGGLEIIGITGDDDNTFDLDESEATVEDEEPDFGWGDILLRVLDVSLFISEEFFKAITKAFPIASDVVNTATTRTLDAIDMDGKVRERLPKPLSLVKKKGLKSLNIEEEEEKVESPGLSLPAIPKNLFLGQKEAGLSLPSLMEKSSSGSGSDNIESGNAE